MQGYLKLHGLLAVCSALCFSVSGPTVAQGVEGMTDKERFDRARTYLTTAVNGQGQLREANSRSIGRMGARLVESYDRNRIYHSFTLSSDCSASLSYTVSGRYRIFRSSPRETKAEFRRSETGTSRWHFGSMTEATTSEAEGQYVLWIKVPATFNNSIDLYEDYWSRSLNSYLDVPKWGRQNNPPEGDDDVKIRFRDSITRDNARRAAEFIQSYCKGKDPNVMEF